MSTRKKLIGIAKLVLAALLFAQAAIALAGCEFGPHAPADAIAAMNQMPCCQDEARPDGLAGNVNLCLVHCTSNAQSVDTSSPPVPAIIPAVASAVPPVPAAACFAFRRAPPAWPALAGPPLTILFQTFRI